MGFVAIEHPDDPRLAAYRSLKGKELEREGIFIAEGEKVVRSMLESGCRIASCLTSRNTLARYKPLIAAIAKRKVPVYNAPRDIIESIIGFRFHGGIMAVGFCPEKHTALEVLKTSGNPLPLVALCAVNDPQNVGLMVRNVAAFNARALLVDHATYDPYYRKAVRVSMGTIFNVQVCYEDDLAVSLCRLKKDHGTRIIATTPGRGSKDIRDVDLSGNICLVFGNEDKGLPRNLLSVADVKVRIPISKAVDSLNVASAGAVCLYEAARARRLL